MSEILNLREGLQLGTEEALHIVETLETNYDELMAEIDADELDIAGEDPEKLMKALWRWIRKKIDDMT